MKFTLSWLKDHLETNATVKQIGEVLTKIGHEVEDIQDQAEKYKDFFAVKVLGEAPHPDADRLKVLKVDAGGKEPVQVVCGAPNARKGMTGIFAPVGSIIPGLDNMLLKKGSIRGVDSFGMMVSEREMCLSDEHDGIIDLPEDVQQGTPMADIYGLSDPVFEIALTPNRGDCAGVRGIARDLAAAGIGTLKDKKSIKINKIQKSDINIQIDTKNVDPNPCPEFLARQISGVRNIQSPDWLQNRLKAIGLRPISALVDITNYISIDLCQPMHMYDFDKVKGNIGVRLSHENEQIRGLDGQTYTLNDQMTVVTDGNGVIALGGIIGGLESSCSEDTSNVLLECATFDPMRTARTGRDLGIITDARYRYERGTDPAQLEAALDLATQMVVEICGGEASQVTRDGAYTPNNQVISYNHDLLKSYTAMDIDAAEQDNILLNLGFEKTDKGFMVPSWRHDVFGAHDLVEEIARIYGFDHIPNIRVIRQEGDPLTILNDAQKRGYAIRRALSAAHMHEAVAYSFIDEESARLFGGDITRLKLLNPISQDMNTMRPSALPGLIQYIKRNINRGTENQAWFEVGPIYSGTRPEDQHPRVSIALYGARNGQSWATDMLSKGLVDTFDAKRAVFMALEASGFDPASCQISRDVPDIYHPGLSGALKLGKNTLANFGMLHPKLSNTLGLEHSPAIAEIHMDMIPLPKKKSAGKAALASTDLPNVARDFGFLAPAKMELGQLPRIVNSVDRERIKYVEIFDIYQGDKVDKGQKTFAFRVMMEPLTETFTDTQIETLYKKIVDVVEAKTEAKFRAA